MVKKIESAQNQSLQVQIQQEPDTETKELMSVAKIVTIAAIARELSVLKKDRKEKIKQENELKKEINEIKNGHEKIEKRIGAIEKDQKEMRKELFPIQALETPNDLSISKVNQQQKEDNLFSESNIENIQNQLENQKPISKLSANDKVGTSGEINGISFDQKNCELLRETQDSRTDHEELLLPSNTKKKNSGAKCNEIVVMPNEEILEKIPIKLTIPKNEKTLNFTLIKEEFEKNKNIQNLESNDKHPTDLKKLSKDTHDKLDCQKINIHEQKSLVNDQKIKNIENENHEIKVLHKNHLKNTDKKLNRNLFKKIYQLFFRIMAMLFVQWPISLKTYIWRKLKISHTKVNVP